MAMPVCAFCGKRADEISEYQIGAQMEEISVEEYVREFEGTYNPVINEFACTECYIKIGMPSAPLGWRVE